MKKINSIGYGHRILGAAAIFLIVIPACLFALSKMLLIRFLPFAEVSLAFGFGILLFLLILLKIELFQDKKKARYFEAHRHTKLALKNGLYECQACGNQQVRPEHKTCAVCGVTFQKK